MRQPTPPQPLPTPLAVAIGAPLLVVGLPAWVGVSCLAVALALHDGVRARLP